MTEAERVNLYNDLCDLEIEMQSVMYPPKVREVDILHRAVEYVRGVKGRWIVSNGIPVFDDKKRIIDHTGCTCDRCKFSDGRASFRFCPNCGARMK